MDMLNTRNKAMILGRPFLATIHAKIDVFNKEISLGIGGDRVTFDKDKKIHKFTTPIGEIYMINTTSDTPSDASSRVEKTNDVHTYQEKKINGAGLSFPKFLLVKYGENQEKGLIWDERFEEWCINNPNTPTLRNTKDQKNLNPRPKNYPFKDWLLTKLADEYELGIGNKGHMLDDIWENYRKVQGDNTYWWHDQKEEEERRKLEINIEEYDPPMVHVETFKVKRYSFDTSQSFICVTKELMDALPMVRENGSRFRDMIRKEVDSGRRIHRQA
ncbi:hypothetical protein Tco_0489118 [Tanacetum coccineum]